MAQILTPAFFRQPALLVAPELLGKYLVRRVAQTQLAAMITEVEAYTGPEDLASHASGGRRTARTEVMFARGGVWYPHFVYGMHWMLNIITGELDHPSGILIRGVVGTSGPGRVGKLFKIDKSFYGLPAAKKTNLWIEDRGVKIEPNKIKIGPRIGIDYAGPIWSKKPYRFYLG